MKQYLILALVLIITLSIVNGVGANDVGNTVEEFWIKTNKIHCVSVVNPEVFGKNYFLLFDYSPNVGEKLGRPWSIVTQGKCYEFGVKDMDGYNGYQVSIQGELYAVKVVTGKERQELSDYSKFKPTDSITSFKYDITQLWPIEFISADELSLNGLGIQPDWLLPTKYNFGPLVITNSHRMLNLDEDAQLAINQVFNDEAFLKAKRLYLDLNESLQDTIKSCDNRVRVEFQLFIEEDANDPNNSTAVINHIIWKFPSGKDIAVEQWMRENYVDDLDIIQFIGCHDAFTEFIQSHLSDFNTFDSLAETLLTKYPLAVSRHYKDDDEEELKGYDIILRRNKTDRRKVLNFAQVADPETFPEIQSSSLEEPTLQKKTEILLQSSNPLMRLYIILPLIALIGIVIFLILKKKSRR